MKSLTLALLSIGLLATISGLFIMNKNESQFALQSITYDDADCLNIEVESVGRSFPVFFYYANNVCREPKIFTIKYKYFNDNIDAFVSDCLAQNTKQDTPLELPLSTIISVEQLDC